MEKFIEDMTVPKTMYVEPLRINGGSNSNNEILIHQVCGIAQIREHE